MSKYSNRDLVDIVESESLGYAIQHYLAADQIRDPRVAALWVEAKRLLDEISDLLELDGSGE